MGGLHKNGWFGDVKKRVPDRHLVRFATVVAINNCVADVFSVGAIAMALGMHFALMSKGDGRRSNKGEHGLSVAHGVRCRDCCNDQG